MDMVKQYEIYWIDLNPTQGSEINKVRPCVVISPDVSNEFLNTVIIAPLTSTLRNFPMRVNIQLMNKNGQIALDQIRCVDKSRLSNKAGILSPPEIKMLKRILKEYLVD